MARLQIKGGTGSEQPFVLRPGVNQFGRADNSFHRIQDPSVSSAHCEILYGDGVVRVRDLGSTNGTYIDSQRITDGVVQPGQVLKLGSVELVLEDELGTASTVTLSQSGTATPSKPRLRVTTFTAPAAESAAPPGEVVVINESSVAPGPDDCANHGGIAAKFICQRCSQIFCGSCIKTVKAGSQALHSCARCGGICVDLKKWRQTSAKSSATTLQLMGGAFIYPLRLSGAFFLACGSIVFTFLFFLMGFGLFGRGRGMFWSIYLLIASTGYLLAFLQSIITSSADGEEDMPGWPEFGNFFQDLFMPCLHAAGVLAFCLGPGLALFLMDQHAFGIPVLILGFLIAPMTWLTVAMTDSFSGLNPFVIFPSVMRTAKPYLLVLLFCGTALGINAGLALLFEMAVGESFALMIAGEIVLGFVRLYLFVVVARVIGLFYFRQKEKLAWF